MTPDMGPPGPTEPMSIPELKALGRSKVIELAKEAARGTGSRFVPEDDKDVKVYLEADCIKVVLATNYRAYDDDDTRRIETFSLVVHFDKWGPSITHEGNDIMTEKDQETLDFVFKKMPSNYEFVSITIIDAPKLEPDKYIVQISSEHTMGKHTVDKRTGEWTYEGHKHFARRPKELLWEE
jgi:hypothetical protein